MSITGTDPEPTLRPLTKCNLGNCPTVYAIEDGSGDLAVQGYTLETAAPDGESIVRIPRDLLDQLTNQPAEVG